MADDRTRANEGEGNRTAARRYNEGATEHAKSGKVSDEAKRAREEFEGAAGDELRRAEEEGKKRAAEEDPAVER